VGVAIIGANREIGCLRGILPAPGVGMRSLNALVAGLVALWIFAPLSLAAQGRSGDAPGRSGDAPGRSRGAPGPIVGAGLPFLVIAGGVYWLVRRRRKE
jgi:hypothetical protein